VSERIARSRSEKVAKAVAREIIREVASGQLPSGTSLPTEVEMAQLYGVGRSSIREALRVLEVLGLVEIRRGLGGGPFIRAPSSADFAETMTMYLQASRIEMRKLYEAHVVFEGEAAFSAAERVKAGRVKTRELARMAKLARQSPEPVSGEVTLRAGNDFHAFLHALSNNPVVELVASACASLILSRSRRPQSGPAERRRRIEVVQYHEKIAAAVQAGDPSESRALMQDHMTRQMAYVEAHDPAGFEEIIDWR
jgi:DNA-binding FadR family transcriptional regulator